MSLLDWRGFVKLFAEQHGITYGQALKDCGEAWKEYKEKNDIKPKPRASRAKPKKDIDQQVAEVAEQVVPKSKAKPKRRGKPTVQVPKAPKGKKMVVSYVTDSEDEEEVKPKPVKKAKANVQVLDPESESEESQEE